MDHDHASPELHAPSARVAAARIPWRRLAAVALAAVVGLTAWALHRQEGPSPTTGLHEPTATVAATSQAPGAVRPANAPGVGLRATVVQAAEALRTTGSLAAVPSSSRLQFHEPRLADFADARPTADVRHLADWAVDSGDHHGRSFVIVDKRDARVWLFDPQGRLQASTPALIGAAVGDDPVPGIGDKPLAEILPEEKTTPAGRYVAEPGVNAKGEDIVWVSYDLAVSLHRVRPLPGERRLERLASAAADDNRISFGCINLPVDFYDQVLSPTVRRTGAIVYVLPETRSPQAQFGSYDVLDPIARAIAQAGLVPAAQTHAHVK